MAIKISTAEELAAATCLEKVDRVSRDPATSSFKAAARLHQSRWRHARNHPMGTPPVPGGSESRPRGSRLPLAYAEQPGANFIAPRCARAARSRLAAPQKHQLLEPNRLHADLL